MSSIYFQRLSFQANSPAFISESPSLRSLRSVFSFSKYSAPPLSRRVHAEAPRRSISVYSAQNSSIFHFGKGKKKVLILLWYFCDTFENLSSQIEKGRSFPQSLTLEKGTTQIPFWTTVSDLSALTILDLVWVRLGPFSQIPSSRLFELNLVSSSQTPSSSRCAVRS